MPRLSSSISIIIIIELRDSGSKKRERQINDDKIKSQSRQKTI